MKRDQRVHCGQQLGPGKCVFVCLVLFLSISEALAEDTSNDYEFDESLFMGSKFAEGLKQFNEASTTSPGHYDSVDVYVNNHFVKRDAITFILTPPATDATPCLSDELLLAAGILLADNKPATGASANQDNAAVSQQEAVTASDVSPASAAQCHPLADRVKGASFSFDQAKLRLDLAVPQSLVKHLPRGYINPADWDEGEKLGFVNYNTNYYRSQARGGSSSSGSDYTFVGLKSGFNFGLWQLRQQSNYRYSNYNGSSNSQWNSIRTYVQRPIPQIESQLTLGETFTEGTLFGTMSFRGAKMNTDQRMWPESKRGYAPQVRGVAATNARVVVSQHGREIYETNVAAGAFVIDDLYNTSSQGDLSVEVIEANGARSTFTVPFSAVPDSMRPGIGRYNAVAGQARDFGNIDSYFTDFTYERGLSNSITANGGVRLAQDYEALLLGGVLGTSFGAFGLNSTFSSAKVEDDRNETGWRVQAIYSQSFVDTGTSFSVAGYHYSTNGYRDLNDVFGARSAQESGGTWDSSTYQQRSQYTLTLNQTLGGYGQVYFSGSTSDYYSNSDRDTQLQFGYSNSFNQISYNVAMSRQKTVYTTTMFDWNDDDINNNGNTSTTRTDNTENIISLNVSIPLNIGNNHQYVSLSASRNPKTGNNYQSSLSGTLGEEQTLNYSLNAGYDDPDNGSGSGSWGVSAQQQFPVATVNGSYSQANSYSQFGAGARGAAVVHSHGVTLGPYLGETFGLIEADGAQGATVRNAMGARIDGNGYAIIPSLTPYNYNTISLDTKGINHNTELKENQGRVVPYAGAAVKVTFETLSGNAVLMQARMEDGSNLPLGADVYDGKNAIIGMAGQASQIYARVKENKGSLYVRWGESSSEQCAIPYAFTDKNAEQDIIHLTGTCR